jgi:hypothetical protein
VQKISDEVTRMLDHGDLALTDLAAGIDALIRDAFRIRTDRLRDYLGELDPEVNTSRLR